MGRRTRRRNGPLIAWAVVVVVAICVGVVHTAESAGRVALVIGNGAYSSSPLRNPPNDAQDVAAALTDLGFDVIELTDAHKGAFLNALDDFSDKLRRAEAGLFYFAGHGMQIRGQNYLLPVGVHVRRESDVEYEGVNANRVLAAMEEAGSSVNIMILDACRDNPFSRTFRSGSRGLAMMRGAKGTFIAYATSPGSVAADGTGRNGVFTGHLLQHIDRPGFAIEDVFKRVRSGVVGATSGEQVPWDSSSLLGDFYFAATVGDNADEAVQAQEAEQPAKTSEPVKTASLPQQEEELPISKPGEGVTRDGHYVAYANGVVLDTKTALEWKAGPDKPMGWYEAGDWVEELNAGGEGGWRMPTPDELMTLHENGRGSRNMTPLLKTRGWLVWAGETKGSSFARGVNFGTGTSLWCSRDATNLTRAFAVRSRGDG